MHRGDSCRDARRASGWIAMLPPRAWARDLLLCSFSFRLQKENEPKEMRFAAVQIPAKIG